MVIVVVHKGMLISGTKESRGFREMAGHRLRGLPCLCVRNEEVSLNCGAAMKPPFATRVERG